MSLQMERASAMTLITQRLKCVPTALVPLTDDGSTPLNGQRPTCYITAKHNVATGKPKCSQRKLGTFHVKCLQPGSFHCFKKKKIDRTHGHNVLDQKGDVHAHRGFLIFYYFLVELFRIKTVKFCLKLLPPGNKKHIFVPRRRKKKKQLCYSICGYKDVL